MRLFWTAVKKVAPQRMGMGYIESLEKGLEERYGIEVIYSRLVQWDQKCTEKAMRFQRVKGRDSLGQLWKSGVLRTEQSSERRNAGVNV